MSTELEKAQARGAQVEKIPKPPEKIEIDSVNTQLMDHIHKMLHHKAQQEAEQNKLLVSAIDRLVDTISEKEFKSKTDVTQLVRAVKDLKQDVVVQPEPVQWRVDFERDSQTKLMKTGITLTPEIPLRSVN